MADDHETSPACPRCSGLGFAFAVELTWGRRTIRYECESCHHQWRVKTEAEPPLWLWIPSSQR